MLRLRSKLRSQAGSDDLSRSLAAVREPSGAASEDYRTLRTNLLYGQIDAPPKVILITSPGLSEGKSTTCANLGVALSQVDKRTLIVDCDLRKPAMHEIFGMRNVRGLVNILAGECDLRGALQRSSPNLMVVTAGPVPPNPAELLSSRRFAEFLGQARKEFVYVLMDSPPVQPVADPAILASQSDGVLLVLDAQSTRKVALRRAMHSLENVGANVIGTVMNNARPAEGSYYGYTGGGENPGGADQGTG